MNCKMQYGLLNTDLDWLAKKTSHIVTLYMYNCSKLATNATNVQ